MRRIIFVTVGAVRAVPISAGVLAVLLLAPTGCSQPQGMSPVTPSTSTVTSTTKIASAGVLGNQRRPDESCTAEPVPAEPGGGTRRVASGAGGGDVAEVDVPVDPARIVALHAGQLDALCALGLQARVVAAAVQPSYLGTVLHGVPVVGSPGHLDPGGIAAAQPDLILGTPADGATTYGALSAIAPTVFTGPGGAKWQDTLRAVGAATGRSAAAQDLITAFDDQAKQTAVAADAAHYQASIVQLTENTVRVYGADNFPASVLATVGVDRPAAQRFTDHPYVEIGSTTKELEDADFSAADADIIYLSFDSAAAKDRANAVLDSAAWRKLSANRDNRVFAVNNEVWQTGQGLVAARGILDDLRWINAPIN